MYILAASASQSSVFGHVLQTRAYTHHISIHVHSMYVCMYVCMDGWMDGWMDGCMYVCLCVCVILLYMRQTLHLLQTCTFSFFIFLHVRCRGISHLLPGGVGRGSWPTKTPLPNPVKTYLPVSALGPSAGSWGIQSSSFSSPFHFVLCHSWCLAQRGRDPYPHGSFHLVLGMPFRRSGIHGTKNFISFVVIITITTSYQARAQQGWVRTAPAMLPSKLCYHGAPS